MLASVFYKIDIELLIIVIVILLLVLYYIQSQDGYNEHSEYSEYNEYSEYFTGNVTYYKCDKYNLNDSLVDIFKKNNFTKVNKDQAILYELCEYDNAENELVKLKTNISDFKNLKFLSGIPRMDSWCSKSGLWKLVNTYFGRSHAKLLLPETWTFDSPDYITILNGNPQSIFIAKTDQQQQYNIKLFKRSELSIQKLLELKKEGYVVIQEYLDDPFIIDNRKTNMRIYTLVVIKNLIPQVFIYNDGFMYYTKDSYNKNSTDNNIGITTGYIDRSVYEKNPLTHKDLKLYLKNLNLNSDKLFNGIKSTIKSVMKACLYYKDLNKNIVYFQIYGIDIQSDSNLNVKLLEINKSPDLTGKDGRDGELKYNMQKDIYKTIGLLQNDTLNGFQLI
jgi:hypothetical protein